MILGYYPKRGSLLVKLFQLEPINTLIFDPRKTNDSQAPKEFRSRLLQLEGVQP